MKDCIEDGKKIVELLNSPFEADVIEWKVQTATKNNKGIQLLVTPYIDARVIMDRLDQVCGGLWSTEFKHIITKGGEGYQCMLSVKIGDEWITRTDAAEVSDIESVKGGHSNALKRAGVQWGIGRYLYSLPKYWVPYNTQGGQHKVYGNYKINKESVQLNGYFHAPNLPAWALPATTKQQSTQQPANHQVTQGQPGNNQQQHSTQGQNQTSQGQGQPNQNGSTPPPSQQTKKPSIEESIKLVNMVLTGLNTPDNIVDRLFTKVTNVKAPYTEATTKQLGRFYHALLAVNTYVNACREYGLNEENMVYFAQIQLKQSFKNVFSLVGVMNKEQCTETLALVKDVTSEDKVG